MDVIAVDSSEHIRQLVASICEAEGWRYMTTSSMETARAVLAQEPVRVILMADRVQGTWGGQLDPGRHELPFLVGIGIHTNHRMWERWAADGYHHLLDKQTLHKHELRAFLRALLETPLRPPRQR